ncbi:MAG: hypothetical protein DRQ59_10990 [Gammaproteobacteria bacterium]|nr:MAG: hypothetical protein DRQ59_10990 [Gammaproteobacteria bacterium]
MMMFARYIYLVLSVLVVGCASTPEIIPDGADQDRVLLDPSKGLDDSWEHQELGRGATTYVPTRAHLGATITATGHHSASILYKVFDGIDLSCGTLQWDWYVAELQETSNLRVKGMDDVGASIMVSFGDPGVFRDKRVPILKYVWANETHVENDIIVGPYQTRYVRTIIVRTGTVAKVGLVRERRNLVSDFNNAFGRPPDGKIYAIGLFTDNDDTREPVTAHYGPVVLICDGNNS